MPRLGSITVRFSLWAGAALLASTVISTAVGVRQERRALMAQVEHHAGQLAELLAADSAQALFTFDVGELENTVSAFARDPHVRLIEIRDAAGKVLKKAGNASGAGDAVLVTREVRLANERLGSVTLGLSTTAIRDAIRATWSRVAIREATDLVLLFAVLSLLVRRVVSRPLARITTVMRGVAEGADLSRRIEDGSHDEIGELARQFDRMADQLDASQRQLAGRIAEVTAKNAELDAFVYSVAHDLKAPLVTIQGLLALLDAPSAEALGPEGRRRLDRIAVNVVRMERLIADLLALARVGREAQPPEPVALEEIVEAVRLELRTAIEARGATITVLEPGTLYGVRSQIEQVFRNLIGNAVKYAGDGTTPTVEIGMRPLAIGCECYVKDNGIGIDPAYHDKVFEIFQRLHDVEVDGTGVGLAVVKKAVDGAGGRVWIDSRRGEGATFHFTWPQGVPAAAPVLA